MMLGNENIDLDMIDADSAMLCFLKNIFFEL